MPATDVGDLRDVVDAINKLCDDMKTSTYDEELVEDTEQTGVEMTQQYEELVEQSRGLVEETSEQSEVEEAPLYAACVEVETPQYTECRDVELLSPGDICVQRVETCPAAETYHAERWSDSTSQVSVPDVTSDEKPASEMYYTASSEVSLLSDTELPDRAMEESTCSLELNKDERKEVVIAGHVAAMRERFESMTRANTPCPDLLRSLSPSLDAIRNITPSPDNVG